MDELLTHEVFQPYLGTEFKVAGQSLKLTSIERRRLADWEGRLGLREPFNLIFGGPPGPVLPEGFQRFTAGDGRTFELYIGPVHTPERGRQDYQASFN